MNFIKVKYVDGQTILINLETVTTIEECKDGTLVFNFVGQTHNRKIEKKSCGKLTEMLPLTSVTIEEHKEIDFHEMEIHFGHVVPNGERK